MAKATTTTDAKVAKAKGGKSGKSRVRRGFWNRALQAPKVEEALKSLKVDLKAFEKAYSLTRKSRERGEITPEQLTALKAFAEDRDFAKLANAIGKSDLTVSNLLTRAMREKLI